MRSGPKISRCGPGGPPRSTIASERSLAASLPAPSWARGRLDGCRRHSRHRGKLRPSQVALLLQPQAAPESTVFWWADCGCSAAPVHFVAVAVACDSSALKARAVRSSRGPPLLQSLLQQRFRRHRDRVQTVRILRRLPAPGPAPPQLAPGAASADRLGAGRLQRRASAQGKAHQASLLLGRSSPQHPPWGRHGWLRRSLPAPGRRSSGPAAPTPSQAAAGGDAGQGGRPPAGSAPPPANVRSSQR